MEIQLRNLIAVCELLGAPTVLVSLPHLSIEYCNAAAEDVFGDSQKELSGRQFTDFFSDVNVRRIRAMGELLNHSSRSTFIKESFLQLRRRAGRLIPVNITAASIQINDQTLVLFSIEDLSEFQKLEHEKEALLKEVFHVSKLADIGRLAAGMAHELNNPLTVVLGFAEDLESETEAGHLTPQQLKKFLTPILENAKRMKKIVASMYGIARGDKPEMSAVPVADLMNSLEKRFSEILSANGIEFQLLADGSLHAMADTVQIEQVFTNIVSNAIQALEGSQDKKIEISAIANGDMVRFRIWNNGPEIPEAARDRIFTPFFTTKSVGDGMGLGLYLSYSIIQAHRGQMWFETDKRKGTAFFVELAMAANMTDRREGDKQKILLIEPESFVRQVVTRKLKKLGFDCLGIKNLALAIERIQSGEGFSGLLVEIKNPSDEGLDLLKQVRKLAPQLAIGIVTTVASEEIIDRLEALKVQGVIKKPITDSDLERFTKKIAHHGSKASRA